MKTIHTEEGYPPAILETYLALIRASERSPLFRNLYVSKKSGPEDVLKDGDLACAFFVSSILTLCGLIDGGVHTTVDETVLDLESSGWEKIDSMRPGVIIVWAPKLCSDNTHHRHIGFMINEHVAISNDANIRSPIAHHITFGVSTEHYLPRRAIEAMYFHDKLISH